MLIGENSVYSDTFTVYPGVMYMCTCITIRMQLMKKSGHTCTAVLNAFARLTD